MTADSRIVCQFSCGAASAVATHISIKENDSVEIINAYLAEEHPDNRRFLSDCESWFGQAVTVFRDEEYGASAYEVFRRVRYIKSQHGAPCSGRLKKKLLDSFRHPDDVMVLGFTVEEKDRYEIFCERNPDIMVDAPLVRHQLDKGDCLAMVDRVGIELPMMYRMGYHNANCIGCPKGGRGYWNKIRRDFPDVWEEMATIQDDLGEGSYFWQPLKKGNPRISLRKLPLTAGCHDDEPSFSCSFFCAMAEDLIGSTENA